MKKKLFMAIGFVCIALFISGIAFFIPFGEKKAENEENDNSQAASYTLTIDEGNGSVTKTITQATGSSYTLSVPTRAGYEFQGWVMDSASDTSGSLSTLGKPVGWKMGDPYLKTDHLTSYAGSTITYPASPTDLALTNSTRVAQMTRNSVASIMAGFYDAINRKANARWLTVIHAKIPTGFYIRPAFNNGNLTKSRWITDNQGTGEWETYVIEYTDTSDASNILNINIFALSPNSDNTATSVTWQMAYLGAYEATSFPNATGEIFGEAVYTFGTSNVTIRALWKDITSQPLGTGSENDPYKVSNVNELAWIAKETNLGNTFADKYFIQTQNIDLDSKTWTPIGLVHKSKVFCGNYDGQNYDILNFNKTPDQFQNASFALFGSIKNSEIKNVITKGEKIEILPTNTALKDNGVIVGSANNSTILNCKNYVNLSGSKSLAGIVGTIYNQSIIEYCENYGDISAQSNLCAGIAGWFDDNIINNCFNYGKITGNVDIGGIIGYSNNDGTIENCENFGSIIGGEQTGGIVGVAVKKINLSNCNNHSSVNGTTNVGGIIGNLEAIATISNCINKGEVIGSKAGGICGRASITSGNIQINICENKALIKSQDNVSYAGGIIGVGENVEISNCINFFDVSCGEQCGGGILGYAGPNSKVLDCENQGDINAKSHFVGGAIGLAKGGTQIVGFVNHGDIASTQSRSAGVIGEIEDGTGGEKIDRCVNYGSILGSSSVGGIIGELSVDNFSLTNSINEGNVYCNSGYTGGMIGVHDYTGLIMQNCYIKCDVISTSQDVGAFIGSIYNKGTFKNCFSVGEIANPLYGWKGPNSSVSMDSCYGISSTKKLYSAGSFSSYQIIGNMNNGYPVMKELFNVFEPNGNAVLSYFTSNGFSKIS